MKNARELVMELALRLYGTPYRWEGDDPMGGFDCSGFVVELLQSVGAIPHGIDMSASGLYEYFVARGRERENPYAGCLVFWKRNDGIVHVGLMLNATLAVQAGGGDASVLAREDAEIKNAFIKVRPISYRTGARVYVDPFD